MTAPQPGASPAPSASGSAAPAPGASAAPAPGASAAPTPIPQKPYDFNSNTSGKGVIGTVRLELGKRTFKAKHDGKSNFILYVNTPVPNAGPEVAFSYIGAGEWTWSYQVQTAGDYTLDLKAADGQWSVHVE